ncbi:MAG: methionyl-tRNA formyltransferase [Actinomycetota bacterium]|nr:methionyl-tRNA formyltransferase [Actinomycetota bacterium]
MKILFFGSSEFSVPFLEEIYKSKHNVLLVVTTTDKPAGRGRKTAPNVVKNKAAELGLDFVQIEKFDGSFFDRFAGLEPDAVVVASFGKIFPGKLFELTDALWFNVHPSLLPKYRGPTPIVSTLLNGDKEGGVSIIEVIPEVDKGGIYEQIKFEIEIDDNLDSLERKSVEFGKLLLIKVLDLAEIEKIKPYPQDEKNATFSYKITKDDLKINWDSGAEKIVNRIRAFSPKPGAYFIRKGLRIKVLKAAVLNGSQVNAYPDNFKIDKSGIDKNKKNGLILAADKKTGILVRCNNNETVKIELLQPQGKKIMSSVDFINGYRLEAGESFE